MNSRIDPDAKRKVSTKELLKVVWPSQVTRIPWWPPDVYAAAATILRRTGGYVRALQLPHATRGSLLGPDWPDEARRIADAWREKINAYLDGKFTEVTLTLARGEPVKAPQRVIPIEVRKWWATFLACGEVPVADIEANGPEPTASLIKLCCVADQASAGIGLSGANGDRFTTLADYVLGQFDWRTTCISVPRDRIAVLPKQHTPQRGLTLRSLAHHLSLHPATEVIPKWRPALPGERLEIINLLLLPWPTETVPGDFHVIDRGDQARIPAMPPTARFFSYEPKPNLDLLDRMKLAFAKATRHADRIHGIVLPELALSVDEFKAAERFALEQRALLIAGVRIGDDELDCPRGCNAGMFQTAGLLKRNGEEASTLEALEDDLSVTRVRQAKHHRWCLDRAQIMQYALGGRIPASRDCWGMTDVTSREVEFFTIDEWLTWAVLICEDLARQDPVAEVIRAVGPNMVVALLMDGPQLKERWPSRYASVLAEDPGSSVLTLTSLGMSRRTQAMHRDKDRSRVIALWRDASEGVREIELEEEHDACVLSLVCKTMSEYTADGRSDGGFAHFPVFAGVHSFRTSDPKSGTEAGGDV